MSAKSNIRCTTDSHSYRSILWSCLLDWFLIQFERFDHAYFQIIFVWYAQRSSHFQNTSFDIDTDNNWIRSIENSFWNNLKSAWEYCIFATGVNSLFLTNFDVFRKAVEQMINNLGLKNFNTFFLGICLSLRSYPNIECKNTTELFFDFACILVNECLLCFENIVFMNWTNCDWYDWNLTCPEEFKEGF